MNTEQQPIKVAHLCMQHYGGAGTSTCRLHRGLLAEGVDSTLCVLKTRGDEPGVRFIAGASAADNGGERVSDLWGRSVARWNAALRNCRNISKELEIFTDPFSAFELSAIEAVRNADILNFHWIPGMVDFVRDVEFLAGKPVVWTMKDMSPMTGGCHYSVGCDKWTRECADCHLLGEGCGDDPARSNFRIKREAYGRLDVCVVSPSRWLADCAGQSTLLGRFPRRVIPNAVPVDVFRPYDRQAVRRELGVPEGSRVVLFGAAGIHNRRKGLRYLVRALELLAADPRTPPIVLALFGEFGGQAPRLPFPVLPAGYVTQDAQLALLYAMADAYVLPSLEENLPNVILESLACGTPVVAFDTGGIPDMIEHRKTGWLVPPGDAAGLADGLRWALAAQGPEAALRTRLCRSVALERYPLAVQARAYANLYRKILARRAGQGI